MAGTTTSSKRTQAPGSDMNDSLIQQNRGVSDLDALRAYALTRVLGNGTLGISTNFDVKNTTATPFMIAGVAGTLAANTNCDTGTTATIATTKWNAMLVTVANTGTPALTGTWATTALATYASEALAIAALAAVTVPAASAILGYVTVQAAGITWTAGTDALTTGTGGTAATATNYYNDLNALSLGMPAITTAKIGDHSGTAITA